MLTPLHKQKNMKTPNYILCSLIFLSLCLICNNLIAQQVSLDWAKLLKRPIYPDRPWGGDLWPQIESTSMAQDSKGNTFVTGYIRDSIDFDPGPNRFYLVNTLNTNPRATPTAYVLKLDPLGNFLWAKILDGNGISRGISIKIDASDDVYLAGSLLGDQQGGTHTFDFDLNPLASQTHEETITTEHAVFILKLDNNGAFDWVNIWASNGIAFGSVLDDNNEQNNYATPVITIDSKGDVYATGKFSGTVDFDPNYTDVFNIQSSTTAFSNYAAFVLKLNKNGNFLWAKHFEALNEITPGFGKFAMGYSVITDINNNVIVIGKFHGEIDFNPDAGTNYNISSTAGTNFNSHLFVVKLDVNGNYIWAKSIGNEDENTETYGSSVTDHCGNVIIGMVVHDADYGFHALPYTANTDVDPGIGVHNIPFPNSGSVPHPYVSAVVKLDVNGNFIWATPIVDNTPMQNGEPATSKIKSIAIDIYDNIYTAGFLWQGGGVDFDSQSGVSLPIHSTEFSSSYISKLDVDGKILWGSLAGMQIINAICIDNNNGIFMTGEYFAFSDYDPGAGVSQFSQYDTHDIFIIKWTDADNNIPKGPICTNSIINFTASPLGTYNCLWDFGDGITAVGLTASHTYQTAGVYIIKVSCMYACSTIPLVYNKPIIVSDCTPPPCENCIGSFQPSPGKYILSAWVKEEVTTQPKSYDNAKITISFNDGSTPTILKTNGAKNKIIEGWQRIEEPFTIPSNPNATNMTLALSTTANDAYFDDIRIFPEDGQMKTYVYDPVTLRLTATLDENNYATFYEYDEEGKLIRVKKETEKGIMTIQEIRESSKKQ